MSDFSSLKYFEHDQSYYRYSTSEVFRNDEQLLSKYPEVEPILDQIKANGIRKSNAQYKDINISSYNLNEPTEDTIQFLDKYIPLFNYEKVKDIIYSTQSNEPVVALGSLIQKRIGKKWINLLGTSSKGLIYNLSSTSKYVFISFGIGEAIILKQQGLNYISFGSDSGWQNNSKFNEIISKIPSNKEIVILQDNDTDIKDKLVNPLYTHILSINNSLTVKYFEHEPTAKRGTDLRDILNQLVSTGSIKNNTSINYLLTIDSSFTSKYKDIDSGYVTSTKGRINTVYYTKPYIGEKVLEIVDTEPNGAIIISKTGSGKTFLLQNKPGILIIVPRVKLAQQLNGLTNKEDTDTLIEEIDVNGSSITYDKFYGHYTHSEEFRNLIDSGYIKVIVDEAHTLLSQDITKSKRNYLIYSLPKAFYLSGTLSTQFRHQYNTPIYKFINDKKITIKFRREVEDVTSIIAYENAKICMNQDRYFVGSSTERVDTDGNILPNTNVSDVCNYSEEYDLYHTSSLREGYSISKHASFKQAISVMNQGGSSNKSTLSDRIQDLNRCRGDVERIIYYSRKDGKEAEHIKVSHYITPNPDRIIEQWDSIKDLQRYNPLLADVSIKHSSFVEDGTDKQQTLDFKYFMAQCYIAHTYNKNRYDTDLYEVVLDFDYIATNPKTLSLEKNDSEVSLSLEYDNKIYTAKSMTKYSELQSWIKSKQDGSYSMISKLLAGKTLNVKYIAQSSNVGKNIIKGINEGYRNKKLKGNKRINTTYFELLKIIDRTINVQILLDGSVVKLSQIKKLVDIKNSANEKIDWGEIEIYATDNYPIWMIKHIDIEPVTEPEQINTKEECETQNNCEINVKVKDMNTAKFKAINKVKEMVRYGKDIDNLENALKASIRLSKQYPNDSVVSDLKNTVLALYELEMNRINKLKGNEDE